MKQHSIFRITSMGLQGEKPAFAPDESALSFEEAYRNFMYNNEIELFSELVTFNRMSFMFKDFDIPGFDPAKDVAEGEDVIRHGEIMEDGSIRFSDGQVMPAEDIWGAFGLDVPQFSSSLGL